MSSDDPPEFQPTQPAVVQQQSTAEHLKDLVIAFKWPITIGGSLLGLTVIVAVAVGVLDLSGWLRDLMLAMMASSGMALFFGPTVLLVGWWIDLRSRTPVLHSTEDVDAVHCDLFAPEDFADIAWEGEDGAEPFSLASDAGAVYIARDHEVRQVERVDPETGEKEKAGRHVFHVPWPGESTWLEFIQRKGTLKNQWNTLVPLAVEAVDAKASKGTDVLDSTVETTMRIIRGVEDDVLFENVNGDDLGDDLGDFAETHSFVEDDQEDRAEHPDPGSKEMDEQVEDLGAAAPADVATDGGADE